MESAAILWLISLYHKHLSTKELAERFQVVGLFTKGIRATAPAEYYLTQSAGAYLVENDFLIVLLSTAPFFFWNLRHPIIGVHEQKMGTTTSPVSARLAVPSLDRCPAEVRQSLQGTCKQYPLSPQAKKLFACRNGGLS